MEIEKLKYPIGKFEFEASDFETEKENWLQTLKNFPFELEQITSELSSEKLNWIYRPEGWTVKQVVHHCADSHMNSFIRFKLALTEENPIIKPYEEQLWAEMVDEVDNNLSASLSILKGVHYRWVKMLESLTEAEWNKQFQHPQTKRVFNLKETLGLYAWHCNHHFAHINQALKHKGTF